MCFSGLTIPTASVMALPREHSDHTPIFLRTSYLDFGASPFRFFNSWMQREDFDSIVKNSWSNFNGMGAPDRVLSDRLKDVKLKPKEWRRQNLDKEQQELTDLRNKVNAIELEAEVRNLSDTEISDRRNNKQKILHLEGLIKTDLIQKNQSQMDPRRGRKHKIFP
ncbi:hypothetical protein LXL04_038172 [Taraxacum kok-saghyz]